VKEEENKGRRKGEWRIRREVEKAGREALLFLNCIS
jgi:hypothetical protein